MVTVVIPVGPGHKDLLPHALRSCTQPGITRVIVVNDTGGALDVPSLDGGMRGVAHARNLGAARVTTPYLMFLDADDILMPKAASALLAGLEACLSVDYVYGCWWETDAAGRQRFVRAQPQSRLMAGGIHPITCLLPTKLAQSIPFESDVAGWEDWVYWMEVAARGYRGCAVDEPILIYRQHTGERRDQSYAKGESLVGSIRARFGPRLAKVNLMVRAGCRSCGGSHHMPQQNTTNQFNPGAARPGMVLVEYIGRELGPRRRKLINGRSTPAFGGLDQRIQSMPAEDADLLVSVDYGWPDEFRILPQPDAAEATAAQAKAITPDGAGLPEGFFDLSMEEQFSTLAAMDAPTVDGPPWAGGVALVADGVPELITGGDVEHTPRQPRATVARELPADVVAEDEPENPISEDDNQVYLRSTPEREPEAPARPRGRPRRNPADAPPETEDGE